MEKSFFGGPTEPAPGPALGRVPTGPAAPPALGRVATGYAPPPPLGRAPTGPAAPPALGRVSTGAVLAPGSPAPATRAPLIVRKQAYYQPGTTVEIKSQSQQKWVIGTVQNAQNGHVIVQYSTRAGPMQKDVVVGSPDLRQYVPAPSKNLNVSIGDKVEVFSASKNQWFTGTVQNLNQDFVEVMFLDSSRNAFVKQVPRNSPHLRVPHAEISPAQPLERVVTAYEDKYGAHPSFFDFDHLGQMVMNESAVEKGCTSGMMHQRRPIQRQELQLLVRPTPIHLARMDSRNIGAQQGTTLQRSRSAPAPPMRLQRRNSAPGLGAPMPYNNWARGPATARPAASPRVPAAAALGRVRTAR